MIWLLGFTPLLAWLYLLFGRGMFWMTRERDDRDAPLPEAWPSVVAVVPARDEADVIARTLGSVVAQDYKGPFRVILVDDQSSDETAEIARNLNSDRLTVMPGAPRPAGWTGHPVLRPPGAAGRHRKAVRRPTSGRRSGPGPRGRGRPLTGHPLSLPLPAPDGLPLVPVDFRYCRSESCAVAAGPHLTASNRRTTVFTQLLDHRRSDGTVELIYWEYRPTLGWRAVRRTVTAADIAAAAGTEVLASQDPKLVPLETLPGHDHYDFPATETPPWQWHVEARYPGWSD